MKTIEERLSEVMTDSVQLSLGSTIFRDAYNKIKDQQAIIKDLIDKGYTDENLEQAHMAGQADAGVDPSWSNSQAWVIEFKEKQSGEN